MIKLAAPIMALVLAAGALTAQIQTRVFSHPLVPTNEALDRLNLKLAWRTFLPIDDSRDGLATVQVMGDRIFIQARNGAVHALDADTGQALWRARLGPPYNVTQPLAVNYDTVFGVNGSRLFALDRATGRLKFEMNLPNVPSAPLVADSLNVYICLTGSRLNVYRIPIPEFGEVPPPRPDPSKVPAPPPQPLPSTLPTGARVSTLGSYYGSESRVLTPLTGGNRPPTDTYTPLASALKTQQSRALGYEMTLEWEYLADSRLELAPLLSPRKPDNPGYVLLTSAKGVMYGSSKIRRILIYSFESAAPVSAPPGQYGDIAYIPFANSTLQAMNIENGRMLWRLAIGGTTRHQPVVNDDDVYLMPERSGLYRINRASGEVVWQNQKGERFLAANRQLVYALDSRGQLLVLDRARGTQLSSYDARDYVVPVVNEYTDRLFLAAHDGLLLCLRDRLYPTAAWNKQLLEEKRAEPRKKDEKMMEKQP
jgi:outer membrane protein assembly factor BamB